MTSMLLRRTAGLAATALLAATPAYAQQQPLTQLQFDIVGVLSLIHI